MLTDTDTSCCSLHKFNLEEDKRLRKAFVRPALDQNFWNESMVARS